jgi:hypothetical protein
VQLLGVWAIKSPAGLVALRRGSVGFRFQNLACDDQIIVPPPSPILARSANGWNASSRSRVRPTGHEVSSLTMRNTDAPIPAAIAASAVAEFGMDAQPVNMMDPARKKATRKANKP